MTRKSRRHLIYRSEELDLLCRHILLKFIGEKLINYPQTFTKKIEDLQ